MNTEKTSSDPVKLPDGTVVRFKTKKLGVAVFRQRYGEENNVRYSRPFYYAKMVAGKIARFPVGTDKARAERLAEEIHSFLSIPSNTIEMAVQTYNPRKQERATKIATFRDVIDTFGSSLGTIGRNGQSVSSDTFKKYKNFMLSLIRKVEAHRSGKDFVSLKGQKDIDYSQWLDRSTSFLTAGAVMDFKNASLPGPEEDDEEVILTAKITADSILRNARALFGVQALRFYKSKGLNLPDISGFMDEPDFGAKKFFQMLPTEVVVRIMRDSLALRAEDVEAYRAFLLCSECGLRAGEAAAFKPSWLRDEDRPVLYVTTSGTFNPKHGHGRKTFLPEWVAQTIRDLSDGQDFITDSTAFARLNDWIRARIPKEHAVGKPTHELRKLWFSHKVKIDGLLAAAKEGGHADVKITQVHYADNAMPDWILPFWSMPTAQALKVVDVRKAS